MEINGREVRADLLELLREECLDAIEVLRGMSLHHTALRFEETLEAVFPPRKREPVIQTTVESYNAYGHPIFRR